MRPKLLRPTVELFSDGEILDVNDLHRRGAFSRRIGMAFPFRKLRTFPDHIEINFRDRPALVLLVERTRLHLGGSRPWFVCHHCQRRVGKLYYFNIDVLCRKCYDLGYVSQRQRRKKRLAAKAENIRARLWFENNKPIRPRYMHKSTYRKHTRMLQAVEHAIRTGSRCSSIRYRRERERDKDGRYSSF